jgi:hypothetical protein
MKSRPLSALCAFFLVFGHQYVHASAVLTFDDVSVTTTEALIPDGYGGLNWTNVWVLKGPQRYPSSGYDNGTVSGDYVALNGFENMAVVSGPVFNFEGAYLTAAWNNGLTVNVKGYSGANLLYDTTVNPLYSAPTWYQFDYLGVDRLELSSFGGTDADPVDGGSGKHFALDNFTITAVPIPPAVWLFGTGVLGLIGVSRTTRAGQR